jgi:hypothetical protein
MKWPAFFNRMKKRKPRNLVKIVNEKVPITENRIAIIRRVEKNFYYLYATFAVIIVVPLVLYFIKADPGISTIISVVFGFLGFYLGYRALTKVKEVYESVGG